MHKHATQSASKQKRKRDEVWEKIKGVTGLYRYRSSGTFFANVRKSGKLHTESLHAKDLSTARRLLRDFKARLDRTDAKFGKISFVTWLEQHYWPTLKGSESTLAGKKRIIERVKETWLAARSQPMRDLKPSEVERWLTAEFGKWTSGYYNTGLTLIRDAFEKARIDRAVPDNPAAALKYRKRERPIRLTPTFSEFQAIIADVRAQVFNPDAQESADFLEFMGLAGLGQAEASSLTRAHVNFDSDTLIAFRCKTRQGFAVPIYPQLRPLLERLCDGLRPNEHLFGIATARKALRRACARLDLPRFTERSLRRMFITRALELGVDVQTIARWQGHKDGGKLILDTYGHVSATHSNRMALMMATEEPENVLPLEAPEQADAQARA
jgi:integrase